MKNIHQEARRAMSIVAGKLREHYPLVQGILAHPGIADGPLSYNYALKFKIGAQWVLVHWEHPRKVWLDQIEDLAFEMALDEFPGYDLRLRGMPVLARVGNSRKQVVGYQSTGEDGFHARFQELLLSVREAANLEVRPTFEVRLTGRGREVYIVCPVELHSPEDGQWLARRVRQFLTVHGMFTDHYSDYAYTRVDFDRERALMGY